MAYKVYEQWSTEPNSLKRKTIDDLCIFNVFVLFFSLSLSLSVIYIFLWSGLFTFTFTVDFRFVLLCCCCWVGGSVFVCGRRVYHKAGARRVMRSVQFNVYLATLCKMQDSLSFRHLSKSCSDAKIYPVTTTKMHAYSIDSRHFVFKYVLRRILLSVIFGFILFTPFLWMLCTFYSLVDFTL